MNSHQLSPTNKERPVLTIDQVTPELAASIVKHFILPMFESDTRKGLKRKYSRMQEIGRSQPGQL